MKPDPVEQELRELAWRRPLRPPEQARLEAWLAGHPGARAQWEADAALSAALARLPEKPAPSNLTARVLREIERGEVTLAGAWNWRRRGLLAWLPRIAVVMVLLGGGVFWHQRQQLVQQAEALSRLAKATEASPLPSVEALENFEVILKIHTAPLADTELLSMSKQLAEFKP